MSTLPLATVKAQLSAVLDQVQGTHERVTITRNGLPAAMVVSLEDFEGLLETLSILSDSLSLDRVREGQAAVEAGDVLNEAALAALLEERRPEILER